jgi:signal transduction histidine kinase
MGQAEARKQLDEIRRAELTSRLEIALRLAIVGLGSAAYFRFSGDGVVALWFPVYALLELLAHGLLRLRARRHARLRLSAFMAAYALANLTFVALPLHILAESRAPGAVTAALAAMAGHLVYALHRRQRAAAVLYVDAAVFTLEGLGLALILTARSTSRAEALTILAVLAGLTLYAVVALLIGRQKQAALRSAQQGYAGAQKARALSHFVGGVAHDFNNQLTAILGHLELIELLEDPAERAEALAQSRAAAEQAAATVRQLLAAGGRQRLSPAPVEMAGFVAALRDLLGDTLDSAVTVSASAAPGLRAWADRDRLETSVLQLCLNAQDAMPEGGRLVIEALSLSALPPGTPAPETAPPWVALRLHDSGAGVAPADLERLTEPFFTTRPASEGRGLGLAAVAGFAAQSGGALALDLPAEGGLRATLLLPAAASTKDRPAEDRDARGDAVGTRLENHPRAPDRAAPGPSSGRGTDSGPTHQSPGDQLPES